MFLSGLQLCHVKPFGYCIVFVIEMAVVLRMMGALALLVRLLITVLQSHFYGVFDSCTFVTYDAENRSKRYLCYYPFSDGPFKRYLIFILLFNHKLRSGGLKVE